ncbi:MAG: hypothetical protein IKE70_03135 [Bacilli bacterium]|nr:hypothetical protein [Bacilli bacterium]
MNKKEKNNRYVEIRNISLMIGITFIVGIICLIVYYNKSINHTMSYDERSDVDYKVLLKENEFFKDNYLDQNKGYIASLIDKIDTKFKYLISFEETLNYNYSYKIISSIDVTDSINNTNLYHFTEDLVNKELVKSHGNLIINEKLDIDYQKYNEVISKFKEVYQLRNVESNLNISLYVNIEDIDRSKTTQFMNKKVSTMKIPLTLNTVSVDVQNETINNQSNKIELYSESSYYWAFIIGIAYLLISLGFVIYLIYYLSKTRTAQMIYDKEIKSIMNNYDSYIQRINGSYDIGTSQVLKIESFTDMLEIRDTLKQPILMLENKEKNGTFFIIPATNSIIYTYALRVVDIEAKMDGKEIPTYDITEIAHEDLMKKKKYTDKYIKEQITMTTAMPTVDMKNVIKGNKDKDKDLYDQLEMTTSFDVKEIKKAAKEAKKTNKANSKKASLKNKKTAKKTSNKKVK